MKKLVLLILIVWTTASAMAQTILGDRVVARQSLFLRDWWVDSVKRDTSDLLGRDNSVMTADAIYKFVTGRMGGGGSGTVTNIATNDGTGITGGPITTTGTLSIDTLLIATRAWRQKGIDSVASLSGSVPTLQQVLDAGSTLTSVETINVGLNRLEITGSPSGRILDVTNGSGTAADFNGISASAAVNISNLSSGSGLTSQSTSGGPGGRFYTDHTSTNTSLTVLETGRKSTGTAANGLAGKYTNYLESSTNVDRLASEFETIWTNATDVSRESNINIYGIENAVTETFFNIQPTLLRYNNNADTVASRAYARLVGGGGGSGTVTNIATNDGTGITGGPITTTGTLALDTLLISTRAWRQKLADSLGSLIIGQKFALNDVLATGDRAFNGNNFQLNIDSSLLMGIGRIDFGKTLTVSGTGTRMFWYPKKAAFRAGFINGDLWDDANIGRYSASFGFSNKASGESSMSWGEENNATGFMSTAFGAQTTAQGVLSLSTGSLTSALGDNSASFNAETIATGNNSASFGTETLSDAYSSFAIGRLNVGGGNSAAWVATDPLFEIGIGSGITRANAMTVLKNGFVGIGANPDFKTHIQNENSQTNSPTNVAALVQTSSGIPAAGIGTGLSFGTETTAGISYGGILEFVATDVASATEDFSFNVRLMQAGNPASGAGGITLTSKSTGQLQLPDYVTTTSFTGTPVGYLQFDAAGNIITAALPGGSGTVTDFIFTDANGLDGTVTTSTTTPTLSITSTVADDQVMISNSGAFSGSANLIFNSSNELIVGGTDNGAYAMQVNSTADQILYVTSSSTAGLGGTYYQSATFYVPGMTSSQINQYIIGRNAAVNNAYSIDFKYNGSGSSNNAMSLGFYGANDLALLFASGNFRIGGAAVDAGYMFHVEGTTNFKGESRHENNILLADISIPGNPPAGFGSLYVNSSILYFKDASGNITDLLAGGSGGHIIKEDGTGLTARSGLNFVGVGLTATDDVGNNETDVTLDPDLETIAGLTATTDNFIVSVASAWASRTPAQVRTTLSLVIGTDIQAFDADLSALSSSTGTKDNTTYYGGDGTFHPAILSKGITIQTPTATENIVIYFTPIAITITQVETVMIGTSQSITFTLNYGASRATADGTIVASNVFDSGDAGYQTTGFTHTLNTTSIPANSYIWLTTSATSGTVNDFNLTITYRQ